MEFKIPQELSRTEIKDFARPGVDQRQVSFKCSRSDAGEVAAFGIELAKKPIAVLIGSFLPGAVRIREVDVTVKPLLYVRPVCKLGASVAGDGLHKAGRE